MCRKSGIFLFARKQIIVVDALGPPPWQRLKPNAKTCYSLLMGPVLSGVERNPFVSISVVVCALLAPLARLVQATTASLPAQHGLPHLELYLAHLPQRTL